MENQSDPSDEIICSNCGRPNLREAVKCWYCQAELNQPADRQPAAPAERDAPSHDIPRKNVVESKKHIEPAAEDLPEWLQRIRELKQQDQVLEEEKDKWQQHDLFKQPSKNGSKPIQPSQVKPNKPVGGQRSKSVKDEQKKSPVVSQQAQILDSPQTDELTLPPPTEQKNENKIDSEELPEGFTKFDPKSK